MLSQDPYEEDRLAERVQLFFERIAILELADEKKQRLQLKLAIVPKVIYFTGYKLDFLLQ